MRHQHKARRTEAALEGAAFDKGLLHRGKRTVRVEALDGRNAFAVGANREIETAGNGAPIDENRTAAAKPLAAAFARTAKAELVQKLDEIEMRLDDRARLAAVKREADFAGRAHSSSPIGFPAASRTARRTVSALIGSSVMRIPTAS